MGKVMLMLMAIMFLFTGVASANILEDAIGYITAETKITGVIYTDKSDLEEVIGVKAVDNVLEVNNLDIDVVYDLDKMVGAQASYIVKDTSDFEVYVAGGIGADRIEKLETHRIGESILFLGAGIKF